MRGFGIELPENAPCAFCDYLSGRRPYTVLWQEEKIAVLVTREQRGIGHLLVLPNRHIQTLLDLADTEAEDLMIAVRDAALTIDQTFKRSGVSVWQNNGISAHQAIPHLHFHVAGTLPEGGTDLGHVSEISLHATNQIGRALTPEIPPRPSRRRIPTLMRDEDGTPNLRS